MNDDELIMFCTSDIAGPGARQGLYFAGGRPLPIEDLSARYAEAY